MFYFKCKWIIKNAQLRVWTISNIMFAYLQQWHEPNQILSLQTIKLLCFLGAIQVEFLISKTFWMQVTWC